MVFRKPNSTVQSHPDNMADTPSSPKRPLDKLHVTVTQGWAQAEAPDGTWRADLSRPIWQFGVTARLDDRQRLHPDLAPAFRSWDNKPAPGDTEVSLSLSVEENTFAEMCGMSGEPNRPLVRRYLEVLRHVYKAPPFPDYPSAVFPLFVEFLHIERQLEAAAEQVSSEGEPL